MARNSRKNRLEDIARHAGVGVATVDRVLNERGGVSEKTTARVLASAQSLGTKRVLPSNRERRLSIEAVLFRNHSAFYSRLNQALKEVTKLANIPATIYRTHIDVGDPERLISHLESIAESRDGIILFASDLPQISDAINRLAKQTTIVTISTDIPDSARHCYIGIDNFNAGQSAAKISEAICRKGGRILVIEPDPTAWAQMERFNGFLQFFANRGEEEKLYRFYQTKPLTLALGEVIALLKAEEDIRVLYSPINNEFLEMLVEAGRHETTISSVAKIVHDLSPHSIKNLQSGLIDIVLDSNPMQQVFQAVEFISEQHGYLTKLESSVVDFQLYTSDNLPRTQFI